ncbi:MAG: ATP-binding protein [Deltaproteobacteria bacterium]|nr:ATP-binding protein [Deltaproteobacteria bacterium]
MRFRSPANILLRRAQLVLILAAVVPTILMTATGIILLVVGQGSVAIVAGSLVLAFCTSSLTGFLLGSMFVRRGASLARVQTDFLSSVSHEFRTPITSIRMFIETLRDGRVTDPVEQQRCLRIVGQEMERLDGLVGKLLELSRIEAGRQPFERRPVKVRPLIDEALTGLAAVRMGREVNLEVEVDETLEVLGDKAALGQVFVNLLVNAWKYTPAENKCITIRVYAQKKHVVFDIEDNGDGIPPDERKFIFDTFERGRSAIESGTQGSGLGLAIVRAITRAHGGDVQLIGGTAGACFRVRLPRRTS